MQQRMHFSGQVQWSAGCLDNWHCSAFVLHLVFTALQAEPEDLVFLQHALLDCDLHPLQRPARCCKGVGHPAFWPPFNNQTASCRLLQKDPITAPLLERHCARGLRLDGNALTRWLAAKQGDVEAAAEALHVHAQWRATFMPQGHVPEVGAPAAQQAGCAHRVGRHHTWGPTQRRAEMHLCHGIPAGALLS